MIIYKESELPQGSKAWLDLRKSKITATMASVIAGENPFQTADKLWKELLGLIPPQASNWAMERGKRLEPVARKAYEALVGESFEPLCVLSEQHLDDQGQPWIMASLDGMDAFGSKGLEIKSPGEKTHTLALNGTIPLYYRDQMHWQFLASENRFTSIDYVSFNPDFPEGQKLVVIEVFPDLQRQAELLSLAAIFRKCVQERVPPCGSEFEAAAKLFVVANRAAEIANKKLKEAKELVIAAAGGKSQQGSGCLVSVAERKGTVNWESVTTQLAKESGVSEERLEALKGLFTGESKSVTSVKAATDADLVFQQLMKEQQEELSNAVGQVADPEAAVAEVSAVNPVW